MNASIRDSDTYDAARILPWTLFEPPEPEQAESRETVITGAAAQRPYAFVVVLLRALSAWPT